MAAGIKVGEVYTEASFRFDDRGARRYESRIRGLRSDARRDVVVDARVDEDTTGSRRWSSRLRGLRSDARKDITAEAKVDVDPRGFREYSKGIDKADRDTSRLDKSTGRLRSGIGALGKGVGIAGAALGGALFLGARKAWTEFEEAAKVGAQTEAVIKSTGGAANVTADQVSKLATALSNKAGVDDEAIQSGQNLLLTFKEIKNSAGEGNDVFDQTTKAALDMSVAMGTDMRSASLTLGKALNDPAAGLTKLTRQGVMFTDQQKEQIASLQEQGKTMEAQKIILRELNTEFGGSAEAQARPLDRAKVSVLNMFEAVGTFLAPSIEKAATVIADFAEALTTSERPAKLFGGTFRSVSGAIKGVSSATKEVIGWFRGGDSRATEFGKNAKKTVGSAMAEIRKTLRGVSKELGGLGGDLRVIGRVLAQAGSFMLAVARRVIPAIGLIFRGLAAVIRGVVKIIAGILTGDFGKVWSGVKDIFRGALKIIFGLLRLATGQMREVAARIGRAFLDKIGDALGKIGGIFRGGLNAARKVITGQADNFRSAANKIGSAVVSMFRAPWDNVKAVINSGLSAGRKVISGYADNFRSAAGSVGKAVISGISFLVRDLPGKVRDAVGRGATAISNWVSNFRSRAASLGQSVVSGLVNGLRSGPAAVASAARSLGSSIISAVTNVLDIRSPSRVFADVGRQVINGLIGGMNFADVRSFITKNLGGLKSLAGKLVKNGLIDVPLSKLKSVAGYLGQPVKSLGKALGFGAKQIKKLVGKARGGRVDEPTMITGEEAPQYSEYVVSTNPRDRPRMLKLFYEIAGRLGIRQLKGGTDPLKGIGSGYRRPLAPGVGARQVAAAFPAISETFGGYEKGIANLERAYSRQEQRFAFTEEELLTEQPDGSTVRNEGAIRQRVGEINELKRLRTQIQAQIAAWLAAVNKAITAYRAAIGVFSRALKGLDALKKPRTKGRLVNQWWKRIEKTRGDYYGKIGAYQGRIGELSEVAGELGQDWLDQGVDVEALQNEAAAVGGTAGVAAQAGPAGDTGGGGDGGGGSTAAPPSTEEIAGAAYQQLQAFQSARSDLFKSGRNYTAAGEPMFADASAQAAGTQAFGGAGSAGYRPAAAAAAAEPRMGEPGGQGQLAAALGVDARDLDGVGGGVNVKVVKQDITMYEPPVDAHIWAVDVARDIATLA